MSQSSTPFDLRATQEYRELGFKIVNCPVCGKEIWMIISSAQPAAGNTTAPQRKTNISPVIKQPLRTIEKIIYKATRPGA